MKGITFEVYREYLKQRLKALQGIIEQLEPLKCCDDVELYLELSRYMDEIMQQLFVLDNGEE